MTPDPDTANPYAPSQSAMSDQGYPAHYGGGYVPAGAVEALRRTRPWVLILAVLGTIGCGIMVLAGIAVAITGAGRRGFGSTDATILGMAVGYAVVGLMYLLPVIHMYRYSAAISQLVRRGEPADLEQALLRQRSIWKSAAILALLFVAAYLLLIGFFIAGAAR